ncbi:MAG: zinc metallopeptidase [Clostridia bacterium]|nr:zinc metallopeptidase [Clostridia bacterium]
MFWILFFVSIGITLVAQLLVKSRYNKYKQVANHAGMTGAEVARRILDNNGLQNIDIYRIEKELGDNYNPTKKSVNLSPEIFEGSSVASLAVAAHECGHAIQDKEGYSFMRLRMKMIPLLNAASTLSYISIFVGLLASYTMMLEIGIIVQFVTLLFELVTLPVEFDASSRALKQLREFNLFTNDEVGGATSMLKACALTYVGALLTTLVQLLRLILILQNNRSRRR